MDGSKIEGALGALVCGLLLSGCPNPNTYTTPRTVAPGQLTHSVAMEYLGWRVPVDQGETFSGGVPLPPTYTLRVGVIDRLEIGARVANMSSLGADLKLNFVRSPVFDAALDPSFHWFHISSSHSADDEHASASADVTYLHAPLLLGFNLSRSFSIVLAPGVSYARLSSRFETTSDLQTASATTGPMAHLGFGFDARLSERFALHPEITFLRTFKEDSALLYVFGLGLNFGRLPSYADVDGEATTAE